MKMALFLSKTPQTFEVVEAQPACLSNESDAIKCAGITPKNKANRIKNLLPTCIVSACTLRARFLLKSC